MGVVIEGTPRELSTKVIIAKGVISDPRMSKRMGYAPFDVIEGLCWIHVSIIFGDELRFAFSGWICFRGIEAMEKVMLGEVVKGKNVFKEFTVFEIPDAQRFTEWIKFMMDGPNAGIQIVIVA